MYTTLVPFEQFQGREADLADNLAEAAESNIPLLQTRHLLRIITGYADGYENTLSHICRAIDNPSDTVDRFVVVNDQGDPCGTATRLLNWHDLHYLKAPVPAFVGRKLSVARSVYPLQLGSQILAWTGNGNADSLSDAYDLLSERTDSRNVLWTLEPAAAPAFIHRAIRAAGNNRLSLITSRHFDDTESRGRMPISGLYVDIDASLRKRMIADSEEG